MLTKQNTNLLIYGIGQLFNLVTPLLVVPYIILYCGIENYGKTSIAMAIYFFLMVFIDYGSDIIAVKEISINRNNLQKLEQVFITTFATKLLLLLGVLFFSTICICYIPFFSSEKKMFLLGLTVLVGQFINPVWYLQGTENFKWITISTILSKIIYVAGVLFFVNHNHDYVYINLWWGIGMIFSNSIAFGYIVQKKKFDFNILRFQDVKKLLKNNFSVFGSQIFVSLQMYAPILFLGYFGNNFVAGQYRVVDQVIVVFKTYIYLFFNFVYSRVCYLLDQNKKDGFRFWMIYNGLNFVFIILSMIVLFVLAKPIINYFTRTELAQTSSLLKIAIFIPLLLSISIPLKQLVLAFGLEKKYVKTTIFVVLVNMFLLLVAIPKYQVAGVFYTLIFTEVLIVLIYCYYLRPKLNLNQK